MHFTLLLSLGLPVSDVTLFDLCSDLIGSDVIQSISRCYGAFPLHGTVRYGSVRFAFPPQFSTAIEWAGLFTRRYNCAASTAVTSS